MTTPTYIALATTVLSSTTDQVTFSSIPSGYRDLIVVVSGTTTNITNTIIYLNNDFSANYAYTDLYASGTSKSAANVASTSDPEVGRMSTQKSNVVAHIMDYSSNLKTSILGRASSGGDLIKMSATRWKNDAVVNRIDVVSRPSGRPFTVGTTLSLYGIEA